MAIDRKTGTIRLPLTPYLHSRTLKRSADGVIVYTATGVPYKDGDIQAGMKNEMKFIAQNAIYGLCGTCDNHGHCAGIRHCARRSSGEKLPAYDPVK